MNDVVGSLSKPHGKYVRITTDRKALQPHTHTQVTIAYLVPDIIVRN
jgi:hypothetical protein